MKATVTKQLDNDRVTVTEWRFGPSDETGFHVHAYDYVVVPLTTGTLHLEFSTETKESHLEVGVSYSNVAGTPHNVVNSNEFEFSFIEIELK